jgi:hypothetical protein
MNFAKLLHKEPEVELRYSSRDGGVLYIIVGKLRRLRKLPRHVGSLQELTVQERVKGWKRKK